MTFLPLPHDLTTEELAAGARRHGVVYTPGEQFHPDGDAGHDHIRLGFSFLDVRSSARLRIDWIERWNRRSRLGALVVVRAVFLAWGLLLGPRLGGSRWNDPSEWVWSEEASHEALITRDEWEAVQARLKSNKRRYTRTSKEGRHYVLAGRVSCGRFGRRMEGTWNHDRPYYRCQIPRDDPANHRDHPATI